MKIEKEKECRAARHFRMGFPLAAIAISVVFFFQPSSGSSSRNTISLNGKTAPLILMDAKSLMEARGRIQRGDSLIMPAFRKLRTEADSVLQEGPFSVMDKPFTPPSGDKHDFMSVATYHWPNPDTPDSLPYVRRDGYIAPDWDRFDVVPMGKMTRGVITLALAYFFTDHRPYAEHAIRLLRTWFLDPKTRMNPHLNYGQAIRGVNEGRGAGIIDTRKWVPMVDCMSLLSKSDAWSGEEQKKIKEWFGQYLRWLLESPLGKSEAAKKNNHGTWYEVQVATYALFTGEKAITQHFVGRLHNRIAFQVQPDGKQPAELLRTRAFHYSAMNLEALCHAAFLGEQMGFDLWHFRSEDGGSIQTALDFLLPYALREKEWPYQQVTDWQEDLELFALLLRRSSGHYPESKYERSIDRLPLGKKPGETGIQFFLFQ